MDTCSTLVEVSSLEEFIEMLQKLYINDDEIYIIKHIPSKSELIAHGYEMDTGHGLIVSGTLDGLDITTDLSFIAIVNVSGSVKNFEFTGTGMFVCENAGTIENIKYMPKVGNNSAEIQSLVGYNGMSGRIIKVSGNGGVVADTNTGMILDSEMINSYRGVTNRSIGGQIRNIKISINKPSTTTNTPTVCIAHMISKSIVSNISICVDLVDNDSTVILCAEMAIENTTISDIFISGQITCKSLYFILKSEKNNISNIKLESLSVSVTVSYIFLDVSKFDTVGEISYTQFRIESMPRTTQHVAPETEETEDNLELLNSTDYKPCGAIAVRIGSERHIIGVCAPVCLITNICHTSTIYSINITGSQFQLKQSLSILATKAYKISAFGVRIENITATSTFGIFSMIHEAIERSDNLLTLTSLQIGKSSIEFPIVNLLVTNALDTAITVRDIAVEQLRINATASTLSFSLVLRSPRMSVDMFTYDRVQSLGLGSVHFIGEILMSTVYFKNLSIKYEIKNTMASKQKSIFFYKCIASNVLFEGITLMHEGKNPDYVFGLFSDSKTTLSFDDINLSSEMSTVNLAGPFQYTNENCMKTKSIKFHNFKPIKTVKKIPSKSLLSRLFGY